MASKKQLISWEVRYILDRMYLPEDTPFSIGDFSFERLTDKNYEHLRLPTLARVRGIEAINDARVYTDVPELGKRRLQDFLGLYILDAKKLTPRIVGEDGFESITLGVKIIVMPPKEFHPAVRVFESFKEDLIRANQRLQAVDFSSKRYAYLRTALDYLLYSAEASRLEEKLIDLVISLEVLFSSGSQELSYSIAKRAASLLGDDDTERAQIFNDIGEIYDERSQIVHGGYSKYNSDETDEHIQKAGKFVKESAKKYLELASKYSRKEINKKLDLAISKAVF